MEIVGFPDFLIRSGDGYLIRDSKLARRIDEENHPEILLQVQLYGWLYEQVCKVPLKGLQVHSGTGDIVEVPYDGGKAALAQLEHILRVRQLAGEPYEPVGWSKCGGCSFGDRCWEKAEASCDVALIPEVDQNLARALHGINVKSRSELLAKFDATSLGAFKRPWGDRQQKVGKTAERILQAAEAMEHKTERLLFPPSIPQAPNYVMFDLEGLPPHLDELDRIYLWGMQVFGERPSKFTAATSGFGPNGDKEGWLAFLEDARIIFGQYGDIPFVHWAAYERTYLNRYIQRFGDVDGIAARIVANLLDMFPLTKSAMVLPLPSYSLKVVEQYVGFKRSQDEYGGDWAMAKFIEATETNDPAKRQGLMDEILTYNQEDLEATWAVFCWLRSKAPATRAANA